MSKTKEALYDDRFLESYVGINLISDVKVATMELLANAWDAGATRVEILWPSEFDTTFSIQDNGHGMTEKEFNNYFRKLSYDRTKEQGIFVEITDGEGIKLRRSVFGRNGKGRFGAFCFGKEFEVTTSKNGYQNKFRVYRKATDGSLQFSKIGETEKSEINGTRIEVSNATANNFPAFSIKNEIGTRFLSDPNFSVYVNQSLVQLADVPKSNIEKFSINTEFGEIEVIAISVNGSDKTTHLHGIAIWVNNRLVGECSWKFLRADSFIDGRRSLAKRYSFIAKINFLHDSVLHDWTDLKTTPKAEQAIHFLSKEIKNFLLDKSKDQRQETFNEIFNANKTTLVNVGLIGREKWEKFIKNIQEECPSIGENELLKVSTILANLEQSNSQYNLIHNLSQYTSENLDSLNTITEKWTLDLMKIVLDEVEYRVKLLDEIKHRVLDLRTDEVHHLQPLFHKGLWIFGPEYESIEFTSNESMNSVIRKLFNVPSISASSNRPDFVVIPEGSLGTYSIPRFADEIGEIGLDRVTIVELKKPGISIGSEQKNQAEKYVKELRSRGLILRDTKVDCFVLGSEISPYEDEIRKDGDYVRIIPMHYSTIVSKAKARLLKLYDRIKHAPFLKDSNITYILRERKGELFA